MVWLPVQKTLDSSLPYGTDGSGVLPASVAAPQLYEGLACDLGLVYEEHAMTLIFGRGRDSAWAFTVYWQASLDNQIWFTLNNYPSAAGPVTGASGPPQYDNTHGLPGSGYVGDSVIMTSVSPVRVPARYQRAWVYVTATDTANVQVDAYVTSKEG